MNGVFFFLFFKEFYSQLFLLQHKFADSLLDSKNMGSPLWDLIFCWNMYSFALEIGFSAE